ncbi:MAG: hypothetical protein WCS89_01390 [Candidatus Paceibacterota bacterium]|jgi:hypothetical protein
MKTIHKNDARTLRNQGYSLSEISKRFGISKSTASLWTKDVILSSVGDARVKLNTKINMAKGHAKLHEKKLERLIKADIIADKLFENVQKDKITSMVALSMMYWCEGTKDGRGISFTNSDPELVRAFIKMLGNIFDINRDKLRICVHLHDYHNRKEILSFWSDTLGISLVQFTNPYMKKSNHLFSKKGYKGCVRVTYFDSHLARVILAFAKKFIRLYI